MISLTEAMHGGFGDARRRPPCPQWCVTHHLHDPLIHMSEWFTFQSTANDDFPDIALRAARHDCDDPDGPSIGQIDFTIRIDTSVEKYDQLYAPSLRLPSS
jgi:hypothetical protein